MSRALLSCSCGSMVTLVLLAANPVQADTSAAPARAPLITERVTGATYVSPGRAYTLETGGDLKKVRDGIFLIGEAGSNITVQIGPEGVLLVDSGRADQSEKVLAAVRALTPTPVTMIINTCYDLDHTGGNPTISAASIAPNPSQYGVGAIQHSATIWASENVLMRLSGAQNNSEPLIAATGWPLNTYFTSRQDLFFNNEAVQMFHEPRAHTDGDTVVFFRRSDVISTGDIFDTGRYPTIKPSDGGSIDGEIAALNHIIDLTVPDHNEEGGTIVVPGHGHIADVDDVVNYRDAITIIRDRVASMIKRGMSLEQVKKARPTLDYDGDYGTEEGPWTTVMFVEAVYADLRARR